MEFDWHDAKSDRNREERGFGFDFAAQIFFGRVLTSIDDHEDYGEVRVKAIGEIDGVVIVVIYTDPAGSFRPGWPIGRSAHYGTHDTRTDQGVPAEA